MRGDDCGSVCVTSIPYAKIKRMFELPLFPLNTVLFPGMPLQLHIFEERYKKMMQKVMDGDQTFGVVLIRRGLEANGPLAEPHQVGCTARIVQVQPLPDARLELVAIGKERFDTISYDSVSEPYLVGQVVSKPLHLPAKEILVPYIDKLRPWVNRYLQRLAEAGDLKNAMQELPEDPIPMLYLSAIVLHVPLAIKQQFLEIQEAVDFSISLMTVYRRELALLGAMLASSNSSTRGFSVN